MILENIVTMWRIDLFVLVLFLPSVELCTVDGGEFLQVLQVKEETTLGMYIIVGNVVTREGGRGCNSCNTVVIRL